MKRVKVAYILIITLIGILSIFRESVNIYWMQTYHADSPLVGIERLLRGESYSINDSKERDQQGTFGDSNPVIAGEVDANTGIDVGVKTTEEKAAEEKVIVIAPEDDLPQGFIKLADDAELMGPNIPQIPAEAILTAGDKLFFVGDSMMQGVAPRVRQSLYKSENIDGVDLSKQSTGLAYPNFYNWPQVVQETLSKEENIKAVIVYLGANDPWDFPVPGRRGYLKFKSADWERAYRERIQKIILSAKQYNLPVIWLGAPCMRKEKLHNDMVYLNTIYQSEVEKFNGRYIPTSDILGCSDEGYNAYVQTDKGSQKVRTNDGIHFTPTGQRLISERVIEALTIVRADSDEMIDESTEAVIDGVIKEGSKEVDLGASNTRKNAQQDSSLKAETHLKRESPLKEGSARIDTERKEVPIKEASTKVMAVPIESSEMTQSRNDQSSKEQSLKEQASKGQSSKNQTRTNEAVSNAEIRAESTAKTNEKRPSEKELQWADGTEVAPQQEHSQEPTQMYPEQLDIWYTE